MQMSNNQWRQIPVKEIRGAKFQIGEPMRPQDIAAEILDYVTFLLQIMQQY